MRVIRKAYSRRAYWMGMFVVTALVFVFLDWQLAITMALLASLVGLYTDAEEAGSGFFASGFFASLTTSSFALVAAAFWATKKKVDLVQLTGANVERVLAQMKAVSPQINWTTESIVYRMPSAFVIFLLLSLAAALVWDRILGKALGMSFWESTSRNLRSFKVPDILVWITLFAVAGAHGQHRFVLLENVCLNLVDVLVLVYLFQGLAVAKHLLTVYRVSRTWQTIGFFFLLLQFMLTSLLGFTDYWVNYRARFTKQRQSESPFKSEN